MGDRLLDIIFRSGYIEVCHTVVQLLLFDCFQAFTAVIYGPLRVQSVVSVVGGLVAALQYFRATDNAAGLLVGTVHQILAAGERKAGEEGRFGCLYVHLCALRIDPVTTDADVLLQGIVDAALQIPLRGHGYRVGGLRCSGSFRLLCPQSVAGQDSCKADCY